MAITINLMCVSVPVSMTTLYIIHIIQNDWVATDNFFASCEPTNRKTKPVDIHEE